MVRPFLAHKILKRLVRSRPVNSLRRNCVVIIVLSLLGLIVSSYSFLHHEAFVSGTFCDLNTTFNCDIVNRGVFSEIFGIPVSVVGCIGYVFLGLAACLRLRQPTDKGLKIFSVVGASLGLVFALYLSSIEAFVLQTWCIVCLSSQLLILLIFLLSIVSLRSKEM